MVVPRHCLRPRNRRSTSLGRGALRQAESALRVAFEGPEHAGFAGSRYGTIVRTSSPALPGRCSGSFASAAITAASTAGGTSGRIVRIGGAGALTCRAITAWGVAPVNGSSPASISYSTHPSA